MLTTARRPDAIAVIHWNMWKHWDRGTPGPVIRKTEFRTIRARRRFRAARPDDRELLEAYGQCPPGFEPNSGVRVSDRYWQCHCLRREVPDILRELAEAPEVYGFRGTPIRNLSQRVIPVRDAVPASEELWLRAHGVPIDAPGHDAWIARWLAEWEEMERWLAGPGNEIIDAALDDHAAET